MILEKNVNVIINKKNIDFYSKLFEVKLKDCINISTENLQRNSNKKISVKCDECGNENIIKFQSYMNNVENWSIYLCSKCSDKHKMKKIYKT